LNENSDLEGAFLFVLYTWSWANDKKKSFKQYFRKIMFLRVFHYVLRDIKLREKILPLFLFSIFSLRF
jgi:hypothetical protein